MKIKYAFLFLVLSLGNTQLKASFEFKEGGARGAALAGAYTAASDDVEAIWWNPAGLRFLREIQMNTSYTNLYSMEDLNYMNVAVVVPTLLAGTWGMGYSSFGPAEYREKDIRLGFSSGLGSGMYLGTNLKRNTVVIGNDGGSASAFGMDVGVIANINPELRMAMCAMNVNNPSLGNTSEKLSRRLFFGLQARPYEGLTALFDMHKPLEREMEIRLGMEVMLNNVLTVRAGTQTRPARFTFGFGFDWAVFSLNYAFLTHSVLTSQHVFALKMRFSGIDEGRSASVGRKEVKYTGKVNINRASVHRLSRLPGIGKIVAKQIIEYREKSGKFRSVRELMNMFGFSETMFNKVKDYITISENEERFREIDRPEQEDIKIEKFSKPEQNNVPILESEEPAVMPDETEFEVQPEPGIESQTEIIKIIKESKKISINKANVKELSTIPGISYPLAQNIVRYRKKYGFYKKWQDLLTVPGINEKLLKKIEETGSLK